MDEIAVLTVRASARWLELVYELADLVIPPERMRAGLGEQSLQTGCGRSAIHAGQHARTEVVGSSRFLMGSQNGELEAIFLSGSGVAAAITVCSVPAGRIQLRQEQLKAIPKQSGEGRTISGFAAHILAGLDRRYGERGASCFKKI